MDQRLPWPAADTITTPRLSLEPVQGAHAQEMVHVLDDERLYLFTGGRPLSREELQARYAAQASGRSADGTAGWLTWICRERSSLEAVGYLQATITGARQRPSAEMAWVITTSRQGRGYATEAASGVAEWLRDRRIVDLVALIHPDHRASIGVARRLGLSPTATVNDGEVRWARLGGNPIRSATGASGRRPRGPRGSASSAGSRGLSGGPEPDIV